VNADEPLFLDVDDVIELHATQLAVYGGLSGLRDHGLLGSAVARPQTSFSGAFVNDGLFAMAAAYLFHIVSNHPFVDGNKRAGLLSAVVDSHGGWPRPSVAARPRARTANTAEPMGPTDSETPYVRSSGAWSPS
jgi:hypothetical protein